MEIHPKSTRPHPHPPTHSHTLSHNHTLAACSSRDSKAYFSLRETRPHPHPPTHSHTLSHTHPLAWLLVRLVCRGTFEGSSRVPIPCCGSLWSVVTAAPANSSRRLTLLCRDSPGHPKALCQLKAGTQELPLGTKDHVVLIESLSRV